MRILKNRIKKSKSSGKGGEDVVISVTKEFRNDSGVQNLYNAYSKLLAGDEDAAIDKLNEILDAAEQDTLACLLGCVIRNLALAEKLRKESLLTLDRIPNEPRDLQLLKKNLVRMVSRMRFR